MPNNNARDTLLRQWTLLQSIPREPQSANAGDIHAKLQTQGYSVTRRTVERDLRNLLLAGFPLLVEESQQPYLWSWSRSAPAMMLPLPSVSDAVLLVAARDYLKPLLPPMLMSALEPFMNRADEILSAVEKNNTMARWRNKVRVALPSQPLIAPEVLPQVLEPLCSALMQETQINLFYQSRSGKKKTGDTTELRVNPHALVHRGVVSYLVGTCGDYEDMRLLALHRIKSASNTYSPMRASPGFNLDDYLSQGFADFGKGEKKLLVARVAPEVAAHLQECKLAQDQVLTSVPQPQGWFELKATVWSTPQLDWWIRGFGDKIVV